MRSAASTTAASNDNGNDQKLRAAFAQSGGANNAGAGFSDGQTFAAHKKQDAHGSRYFFEDWAHGYIINPSDSLMQNPDFTFNYDKMGGGLLATKDEQSVLEVARGDAKSFTLFGPGNTPYVFEAVPEIDNNHYVEVLSSGNRYKIYKKITTKFVRADYVSNGMTAHGNDYDEFVDDDTYFVFDVQANQLTTIKLKEEINKSCFY